SEMNKNGLVVDMADEAYKLSSQNVEHNARGITKLMGIQNYYKRNYRYYNGEMWHACWIVRVLEEFWS
ncbi:13538_t:CDS:2, partial [Dentiscutata heterogama]